jgi:hypothetical protein
MLIGIVLFVAASAACAGGADGCSHRARVVRAWAADHLHGVGVDREQRLRA